VSSAGFGREKGFSESDRSGVDCRLGESVLSSSAGWRCSDDNIGDKDSVAVPRSYTGKNNESSASKPYDLVSEQTLLVTDDGADDSAE